MKILTPAESKVLNDALRQSVEIVPTDAAQMRAALTRIRDEAATLENGGAWAAGLAALCLGTLRQKAWGGRQS